MLAALDGAASTLRLLLGVEDAGFFGALTRYFLYSGGMLLSGLGTMRHPRAMQASIWMVP